MTDENATKESGISDGSTPYGGWADSLLGKPPVRVSRRRKAKRRAHAHPPALSINSLMDIVTIILVYLIKSYATSPIEVKDPAIELPISASKETVEEATVVMVTGPFTKGINQSGQTVVAPNIPSIVVDDNPLPFALTQVTGKNGQPSWRIPNEQKVEAGYIVTLLKDALEKAKKTQEVTAEMTDRDFTGKVVILADRRTPYRVLVDILVTCGQAGYGEYKFAIVKQG